MLIKIDRKGSAVACSGISIRNSMSARTKTGVLEFDTVGENMQSTDLHFPVIRLSAARNIYFFTILN
jgi:hypothetical protein